jgi:hypothetical protein
MKDGVDQAEEAIGALARAYCEAVHFADVQAFDVMIHDRFSMTAVEPDGSLIFWDKQAFLARVSHRKAFEGEPSYEILSLDVAGGDMARVHLWVDAPPRRFEDHLGFVREHGAWKLMTKVFRTADGPAIQG